jgi:hypothetical protein
MAMEYLGQVVVLAGGVFSSWLLIGLRGENIKVVNPNLGRYAAILFILVGLLIGWFVQSITGDYSILGMALLAIAIATMAEVSRMF